MAENENSVQARARLLSEVVDSLPRETTALQGIRGRLIELIGELKLETERGSVPRLFFNSLLQDLHVMEEVTRGGVGKEQDWLQPFLESLLSKITLGAKLHPDAADRFHLVAEQLGRLRSGSREWASVRLMLSGLLSGASHLGLRREARDWLARGEGVSALAYLQQWSSESGGPPLYLSAVGQVIEALGLHLALTEADGDTQTKEHEEAIRLTLTALGQWIESRGVTLIEPELGAMMSGKERVVFRRLPQGMSRRGRIEAVVSLGYRVDETVLAKPTVIVSPGTGSRVLSLSSEILRDVPAEEKIRLEAGVQVLRGKLWKRLEDSDSSFEECVRASLEIIEALREVSGRRFEARLLAALEYDYDGTGLEIFGPVPGTRAVESETVKRRLVYSNEYASGRVIELVQYGALLEGEMIRCAEVLVSAGPVPPDELQIYLQRFGQSDLEEKQIKAFERAQCDLPHDKGRALAREFLRWLLAGPRTILEEQLEEGFRTFFELRLPICEGLIDWVQLVAFLEVDRKEFWNHEGSRRALRALFRPYERYLCGELALEALPVASATGAMSAALGPVPEELRRDLLTWIWQRLDTRGRAVFMVEDEETRAFAKVLAELMSALWNMSEARVLLEEGSSSLNSLGIEVYPTLDRTLVDCSEPDEAFARLDARYHEEVERGFLIGPVYPSVRVVGQHQPGFARISLGSRPRLSTWLRSREGRQSPLGWATRRLVAELSNLDRACLIEEIRGNPGARTTWREGVRRLIRHGLEQSGWQPGDRVDGSLEKLATILIEDEGIELL